MNKTNNKQNNNQNNKQIKNINRHKIDFDNNDLLVIDDFLDNDEIEISKQLVESVKNQNDTIGKPFNTEVNFFNQKIKNEELSSHIHQKLKPFLNQYQDTTGKWQPTEGCGYIFMANYKPGNNFSIHTDTGCHYTKNKKSSHTLLIYLNDDFEGGETSFYNQDFQLVKTIKPKRGRAILFNILLWHTAEKLKRGEKFWIGTEVVSRRL